MKKNINNQKSLEKQEKSEFEPKVIPALEEVTDKLGLLIKQLNSTNPLILEKDKPESELKINLRLTTQKRNSITNERVKTLTITWKDKKEYKDFIRYGLTKEKLTKSENNGRNNQQV